VTAPPVGPVHMTTVAWPESADDDESAEVPVLAWQDARAVARGSAPEPLPAVTLALADALDHALAEPLTALTDLPPFATSAMDGWAVAAPAPGPWTLLPGAVTAGAEPEPLVAGSAAPIATGARVPLHTTAVIRSERGYVGSDGLLHHRGPGPLLPGCDIRPQGQECLRGEPLLAGGVTVTPTVLGLAAASGYDHLVVHRRPTVDLLVLGDELLRSGLPQGGRIRDALGPMLGPWLTSHGARVSDRQLVADDLGLLREAIETSVADVIITTGSTAAGPRDFLHAALREIGARLVVDSVAVRPGHPMLLAQLPPRDGRRRHLIGLPGNPLAAAVGAMTLAVPLLRQLGGHRAAGPLRVPAAVALAGHPRDTRLCPVTRSDEGAIPLHFDGPAMLRGLAIADGLAVVEPGGVAAGALVEVLDLPLARLH